MEEIILKIIAMTISMIKFIAVYGIATLLIQFGVYQLTGISLANKMIKLVKYAGEIKIGG